MAVFAPLECKKIDFTLKLSDRIIMKLPHCGKFRNFPSPMILREINST